MTHLLSLVVGHKFDLILQQVVMYCLNVSHNSISFVVQTVAYIEIDTVRPSFSNTDYN